MLDEVVCARALTLIKGVGDRTAKYLYDLAGSASAYFDVNSEWYRSMPFTFSKIKPYLSDKKIIDQAQRECDLARQKGIRLIALNDPMYPPLLKACDDAPVLLFAIGHLDTLGSKHLLSVVGTRSCDKYGKDMTKQLLAEMKHYVPDLTVISGLAYGIDVAAHRACLDLEIPTFGVLAHGLDRIYPSVHRSTAVDMQQAGGLLTQFPLGTKPERFNFVSRNRIVAGISSATLVVQSKERGGALITAKLARGYDREVLAVPGRVSDELSVGCNGLIADNIAAIALSCEQVVNVLGWSSADSQLKGGRYEPQQLFEISTVEEALQPVVNELTYDEGRTMNDLAITLDLSIQELSVMLFQLEMDGVVESGPGGVYYLKR